MQKVVQVMFPVTKVFAYFDSSELDLVVNDLARRNTATAVAAKIAHSTHQERTSFHRAHSPVAVSYTHLDVYKRQSYYQEDLRDPLFLPDPETPASEEHHDVCSRKTQRPLPKGTCAPENPHAN